MTNRKAFLNFYAFLGILVFDPFQLSMILKTDAVCACIKTRCVDGTCYCEEMTAGFSCSIVVGPAPTSVESNSGKHFLFFDHEYVNWHTARETCTEFWDGSLAMPNTPEKHEFLHRETCAAKINERSSAIWLGFSDIQSEGHWLFENGEPVNSAPRFFTGSVTVSGSRISLPLLNSTSKDERWHFYFTDGAAPRMNRDDMRTLCNRLGNGHLPVKLDHAESQRILAYARIRKVWLGIYLSEPGNLTSFVDEEGDPVYMPRAWYAVAGYPLPNAEQLSKYHNWAYPPEPNGRSSTGRTTGATCVTFEPRGWHDEDCDDRLVPVCAYGPFPFERWHYGGSKYSEPNNGFGNEDCGVMRLDIPASTTSSHSSVLSEFWNDYDCELKFPYVCETTFPKGCISYRGPHTLECMSNIWRQYGCDKEGTESPEKLSVAKRRALSSLNLLPLTWHMKTISEDATTNPEAQRQCYGSLLPDQCLAFNGPHDINCLKDLWVSVGCGVTGHGYPGNPSAMLNSSWHALNLREISDDIKATQARANTDPDAQLNCYGIIFPLGCTYNGPYTLDCLRSVWNESGCVHEGLRYPDKLSTNLRESLDDLDLVALKNSFLDTRIHSVTQAQAQLNCFGLLFPSPCKSFFGPRSDECHRTIWAQHGCLAEGHKIPGSLSHAENISLNRLTMRQVINGVESLVQRAPAGDYFAQTACYGIPFAEGCTSYLGPNSVSCYSTMWLQIGCLAEGRAYPQNAGGAANVALMNTYNLRQISVFISQIRNRANSWDRSAQVDCYGNEFPGACALYAGPHSYHCQVSIWKSVGCTDDGFRHPSRLSPSDNATINSMTIIQVLAYMKGIYDSAMYFQPGGQLNCFGFEFPLGCRTFFGPHPLDCHNTIWRLTGCIPQGFGNPANVSGQDRIHLNQLNLRQLLEHTTSIFYAAHRHQDVRAQYLCFGMKFPPGCLTYQGPNSDICYNHMWKEIGCLEGGHMYPSKLSTAKNATLNSMNLRKVYEYMYDIKEKANYYDTQSQLDCFGLELAPGCAYYRGPHRTACHKSIWKEESCIEFGYQDVGNISTPVLRQRNNMTIVELRNFFAGFYQRALSGDVLAQFDCYGLKFPHGCKTYFGPNSDICYDQIWKEVGCLPEGHAQPSKLTNSQNATLNAFDIRGVANHTLAIKSRAESMDRQAQLDCFGVEFPDDCVYYRGPHSVDCLSAVWEGVGCLPEGDKAPDKLSSATYSALNLLNVIQLHKHMIRYVQRSERGFAEDQLYCYGYDFPTSCTTYNGPHSLDCYRDLWFKVGCVKDGHNFPKTLSKEKVAILHEMDLREVENITEFVKNMSQYPELDVESQLDCFGTVFPEGCIYYRGPHYLDCQESIWYEEGCIDEGFGQPANISPPENITRNEMSIDEIRDHVRDLVHKSQMGYEQAQYNCYGLKFPEGCTMYHGPNSDVCYNSIWLANGCLRGGLDYPSKLSPEKNKTLNDMTLREIANYTYTLTLLSVREDSEAQQNCYGIEFLPGCVYYRGPHTLECLKSTWEEVGCLDVGYKYPENISIQENNTLHELNLKELKSEMLNYSKWAEIKGNVEAQYNCYGLKFPHGCKTYLGPNTIKCFSTIWQEVGCRKEGLRFPHNISYAMNQTLNSSDLREVEAFIQDIKTRALWLNDSQPQLECFGIVFPEGCTFFRGRHPFECQKSIWREQGCIEEGDNYPDKTSRYERIKINKMTIVELRTYTDEMRVNASMGDVDAQLKCFGLKYLDGCEWYRGPNSLECYINIWLDVGCDKQGYDYPSKLSPMKNNTLNSYTLRQVRSHIENISEDAVIMKNKTSQLSCYGIEFPPGCRDYRGPHSTECQESLWAMAGCVAEGFNHPKNVTPSENDTINSMNLNELKLYFENISKNAEVLGHVDEQESCYGMRFPFGCKTYRSPNSVDCYESIWLMVGCVKEGRGYPFKLTQPVLELSFDAYNLREIANHTQTLVDRSSGTNGSEAQLDCFGLEFADGCIFFRGPHTLLCEETIWNESGCIAQGYSFPSNLTPHQNETLQLMDLVELREHMENITMMAEEFGDVESQLSCFGLRFADGCDSYFGPNSLTCFSSVWVMAGCVVEGYQYPSNLSSTLNETLFFLDLREIYTFVDNIRLDALKLNNQSQIDCFGFAFLPGCIFYRGPHPLECQKSIWKDVGCLEVGYKYPDNRSRHERWLINNTMNLVELHQYSKRFDDKAHDGKVHAQLDCYGLKFPNGCKEYRGPHNKKCYQALWLSSGCVEEGTSYPDTVDTAGNSSYYSGSNLRKVHSLMEIIRDDALSYNNDTHLLENQERKEDILLEDVLESDLEEEPPLDNQSLAQLQCFGLVFPYGCLFYRGPHPVDCQISIFEDVGCLSYGYSYPTNLTGRQNKSINSFNLYDVRRHMHNITVRAESFGDVQAQRDCYGMKFPNGCVTYRGPHVDQCYQSIWTMVGCLMEGWRYPLNVTAEGPINDSYAVYDLRQYADYTREILDNSLAGNSTSQLDCFGLEFPHGCTFYRGPHPERCQFSFWEQVGCLKLGYKEPGNISGWENRTRNALDMRALTDFFQSINASAHEGNQKDQLNCYGMKFPEGCKTYRGPNPVKCYDTIWLATGCVKLGYDYPDNYSSSENAALNLMNLREVQAFMKNAYDKALALNDTKAQLDCFGIGFSKGCIYYRGPHPQECQESIWREKGCVEEGVKFPGRISARENASINRMNLHKLNAFVQLMNESSIFGNQRDQLNCFGMVFPPHCEKYFAPHPLICYTTIWLLAGCEPTGFKYPGNTSIVDYAYLESLNLRQVEEFVKKIGKEAIEMNIPQAQLDCFGCIFPNGCKSYHGPHSEQCQTTIWEKVGCIKEGWRAPTNLTPSENNSMSTSTLVEVKSLADHVYGSSLDGSPLAQLDCFGLKFPEGCKDYSGPNPVQCYKTVWTDVGCVGEGLDRPRNFTSTENAMLDRYTLREVRAYMENKIATAVFDRNSQLDCFGLAFPKGCKYYRGPHSLECQRSVWKKFGCLKEGHLYPDFISDPDNVTINALNLVEYQEFVENITKSAESGDIIAQLNCYGMKFPDGCMKYYGPHSLSCHDSIWIQEGCREEGLDYPAKRTQVRNQSFDNFNIRDLENFTAELYDDAHLLIEQSQLDCFGIVFPAHCLRYYGPHSETCQSVIWQSGGCVKEGYLFPANLTPRQNVTVNTMTLVQYREFAEDLVNRSQHGDVWAQLECYGLAFPAGCDTYSVPHSVECHTTIWLEGGCVEGGRKFPPKSHKIDAATNVSTEVFPLPQLDIRSIQAYTELIRRKAGSVFHVQSQVDCFGFEFSPGCIHYRGPHSPACQNSIFSEVGCILDGHHNGHNISAMLHVYINYMNLVQLRQYYQVVLERALAGSKEYQLACYGLEFPEGCNTYEGPSTVQCYKSIWKMVGCKEQGHDYPDHFTSEENAVLHGYTIKEVWSHMKSIMESATPPNTRAQLDCYGFVFPPGCTNYYGSHPVECQKWYWRRAGCVSQGWHDPRNLTYGDTVSANRLTLPEYEAFIMNYSINAEAGSVIDQLRCYGLKFPNGCRYYRGPHQIECYLSAWDEAGCVEHGHYYPKEHYNHSHLTSIDHTGFHESHFVNFSHNQNDTNITAFYDELNLRQLVNFMGNLSVDALGGDVLAQIQCFGLEFPPDCDTYFGPHSRDCAESVWLSVGCAMEGYCAPSNLTGAKDEAIRNMNLDEMIVYVRNVSGIALMSHDESQLNCYGMLFPNGCISYWGPHHVECLNTIWERAGCVENGLAYPGKHIKTKRMFIGSSMQKIFKNKFIHKSNASTNVTLYFNLKDTFNTLHLRQLHDVTTDLLESAIEGNDTKAQLECFGLVFLDGCNFYRGPHTDQCLESVWEDVGCVEEGFQHPANITAPVRHMLIDMTLHEMKEYMYNFTSLALNGSEDAQLDCFGMKFPPNCSSYFGPHFVDCLNSLWERGGCVDEGLGYPGHLSPDSDDKMRALLSEHFMSMTTTASSLPTTNPYTVSNDSTSEFTTIDTTLMTSSIANTTTFSPDNYIFDVTNNFTLFSSRSETLPSIHLRQIQEIIQNITEMALACDPAAQLDCWGRVFLPGCNFFRGPHSLDCLISIWLDQGCVEQGFGYPKNYSPSVNHTISNLNIIEFENYVWNFTNQSVGSDIAAQLECYGLRFPNGCADYRGPHEALCLQSIWKKVGCSDEGLGYPENLTMLLQDNTCYTLHNEDLHYIFDHVKGILQDALAMNVDAQKECFGISFPAHCTFFRGPHSIECLLASWIDSGCLAQGCQNPENLSTTEIGTFSTMTLHELRDHAESLVAEAHRDIDSFPSRQAQLDCYGFIFPCGCFAFESPHNVSCLTTLWQQAGCVREGYFYPESLPVYHDLIMLLNRSNIVEILEIVEGIRLEALACDMDAQFACFGLAFLKGCNFFRGPHSVECQKSIWEESGCIPQGLYNPEIQTPEQLAHFNTLNLREGAEFFRNFSVQAHKGDPQAQLDCFGYKFPNGCISYDGPHSLQCYISIWHQVGCVDEGFKFPGVMPAETKGFLDGCNLHEVRAYMQNITDDAHKEDGNAQMDCFGMAFPCDCKSFYGPHPVECMNMIWADAGCIPEGHDYPEHMVRIKRNALSILSLRDMKEKMQDVSLAAHDGDHQAQINCYGMKFPRRCMSYGGPHLKDCYADLWHAAGCVEEGWGYPYNLSMAVIHHLDTFNLHVIEELFKNISERAIQFSVQSQLECFGMMFPCGCQFYRGPNSLDCQIAVFLSAGCYKEGYKHPAKLRPYENASMIYLNLRDLKAHTDTLRGRANDGNFLAQCECYGVGFPKYCDKFVGPHSTLCYLTIWTEAGCTFDGYEQPDNLTAQALAELDGYTLRDLQILFKSLSERADRMEHDALLACRGLLYPEGCMSNFPPHTVDCLMSVWLGAGCEDIGYLSPVNLSGCDNVSVNDMLLQDVYKYYHNITVVAHYPSERHQLNCYGFIFPIGCVDYKGSNPLMCYKSLWKSSGCLKEGRGHPDNLTQKNISFLHGMNLRQIQNHMKGVVELSQSGDVRSQLDCFGLAFPEGCEFFRGPHSLDCMLGCWKAAGCADEGFGSPTANAFPMDPSLIYRDLYIVINTMRNVTRSAQHGETQAQFACFGMEFVDECANYYGPHSMVCLEAMWEHVGCSIHGDSAPMNLTLDVLDMLNTFNLRDLKSYMSNISNGALVEFNPDAQLECFGIVFPRGCVTFFSLHPVGCLDGMFEEIGCLPDGHRYPSKLQPGEIRTFALMHLHDMKAAMEELLDSALSDSVTDQLNCFGLELPEECCAFAEELSFECFEALWCRVGCLHSGLAHPDRLNRFQFKALNALGLTGVIVYMQNTSRSITSSKKAQLDCIGTEFPFTCDKFYGPHSAECLNAMWIEAGCSKAGTQYPAKLPLDALSWSASMNITEAMQYFRNKSEKALQIPVNMAAQVECFGKPLIQVCGKFRGPYSPPCFKILWLDAGCLLDGWAFQSNLTAKANATINAMNLYQLQSYMRNLSVDAFRPNVEAQFACYGRRFPRGCRDYTPPHTLQCVIEMFLEAGCIDAGHNHPLVVTGYERDIILHMLDLAELHDYYANYSKRAFTGDSRAQLGCFGATFPSACHKFKPPHSLECLNQVWYSVGCLLQGYGRPSNLTYPRRRRLYNMDLARIRDSIQVIYDRAHHPHRPTQLYCFGMYFPRGCSNFDGPHSITCQVNIWFLSRCTTHGLYYPPQICETRNVTINNMNLYEIIQENKNISKSAIQGDGLSQDKCYGLVYPDSCKTFLGPHSYECKVEMWLEVGCIEAGYGHPANLSPFENLTLNELDLYDLKMYMKAIYDSANLSNVAAQYECFGLRIPESCVQFEPPHTIECYKDMWVIVGCVPAGDEYPPKMSQARIDVLKKSNLHEVKEYLYDFYNKSYFTDDRLAHLDCFGTTLAEFCTYHPPIPLECLNFEFIEAGCSEYGYSYPSNANPMQWKILSNLNIIEVREYMANISRKADANMVDEEARFDCYGMRFPNGCTTYRGPHSLPCFVTIWEAVGCGEKGRKHPRRLPYSLVRELSFYTLHDLFEYMSNISDLAMARDNESEFDCFGRNLPPNCNKYNPILSLSCQKSLWNTSGCIEEGFDNPLNYSSEEQRVANYYNLDELIQFMDDIFQSAQTGNATAQENCYGFKFPPGCEKFLPPHRMRCYRGAWKVAMCATDGREYPPKRNASDIRRLKTMNLREILDEMLNLSSHALAADKESQLDCFGHVFSRLCRTFTGPFTQRCLETIWLDVGCVEEGTKAPAKLTSDELATISTMTLVMAKSHMESIAQNAIDLNIDDQYYCYGLRFPRGCEQFWANHSLDCFISIWINAGCIANGWGHPSNYSLEERELQEARTLRQLIRRANRTSERAHVLDQSAQLSCFGMTFPFDCTNYRGPHTIACFNGLFLQAGCHSDGYDFPRNLTGEKRALLLRYTRSPISDVLDFMKLLVDRAVGSDQARLECYGLLFPDECRSYRGPHSVECLEDLWFDAGCLDTGYFYPKNMSRTMFETFQHSTLREIIDQFDEIKDRAERSDNAAILQCFGPIFPPHCKYFKGRHTLECVRGLWISAGCVEEGYKYPKNLTALQNATLNEMNLYEIYESFKNYSNRAMAGSRGAQLDCFGLRFTRFCQVFHPPLSLACLNDIFTRHCIEEGTWFPGRANKTFLQSHWMSKNQREADTIVRNLKREALQENQDSELKCYGLIFPEHCFTFFRDHSKECIISAWETVGCSKYGYRSPENLTNTQIGVLMNTNLRNILTSMNETFALAADYAAGRTQAQLDCFGILLTEQCPMFNPMLSISCLVSLWLGVGCHQDGIIIPTRLSPKDLLEIWNVNLFEARAEVKRIYADALTGDTLAELDCFGIFPDNCTKFNGSLSVRCLSSIWVSVGCKRPGTGYPQKITPYKRRQLYKKYNIRQVYMIILKVLESGLEGDKDDQITCFGKTFPAVCKVYEPPLPLDCLLAIWDNVGCVEEGYNYPENKSSPDYYLWRTMHLGRVQRYIQHFRDEAEKGNSEAQLDCYGILFLNGCVSYEGPHTPTCLNTVWLHVGCIKEGYHHPKNRTDFEIEMLNALDRVELEDHMRMTKNLSNRLNVPAQFACYGFEFPYGCIIFEGPHSMVCLDSVRKLVGLYQFPGQLTPARNRTLQALNLKELIDHFRKLSEEVEDELGPFGPTLCLTTYAPLPKDCLADIWLRQAMCTEDGRGYPGKLNAIQLRNTWGRMNIREANKTMFELRVRALSPDKAAQLQCFGIIINDNCTGFHPTLSRRCLNSLWLYDIGCRKKGLRFPGGLNVPDFNDAWGDKNYREARDWMVLVRERALVLNKYYHRECIGRDIPMWMYAVAAGAIKIIMLTLASIVLLVVCYILFRLLSNYPRMGQARMPKYPSQPNFLQRVENEPGETTTDGETTGPEDTSGAEQDTSGPEHDATGGRPDTTDGGQDTSDVAQDTSEAGYA